MQSPELDEASQRFRARRTWILIALSVACNSETVADSRAATGATSPPRAAEEKPADRPANPTIAAAKPAVLPTALVTFEAYWPVFRVAVQTNDKETVVSLTRFPFETRGDSDDDSVKTLDRDHFKEVLDELLNEHPGTLDLKETQREHIVRSANLTERQYATGAEIARVGNFSFEKQGGRWWFTRAYVSEE